MTTTPAPVKETPVVKTLMDLGHLALPNANHPPKSWLATQAEQREKQKTVLIGVAREYFPEALPDHLFEAFATQAIAALDNL